MHPDTDFEWLVERCNKTDSFDELVIIALEELRKFRHGSEIVCGPISTGGRGSVEANFQVFSATIARLKQEGRPIFSQVPYEERIFFRNRWRAEDPARANEYHMPILEDFYLPLISSGLIKKCWFIPGWESSFGARWEREHLIQYGADICDLTDDWIDQALSSV